MRSTNLLFAAALLPHLVSAQTWTQRSPATVPLARNSTAMAYDEARGRAVMYGGFELRTGALSDTWEWDGVDWTQRSPAHSPGVLQGHALAYDRNRHVIVLFGGARTTSAGVGETWEYDGIDWVQRAVPGPSPRANLQLAYDSVRRKVVMFGGHSDYNLGPVLGDTWEWDGVTWTQRANSGPAPRAYHAMAFDVVRRRCVLHGGRTANATLLDTWEWDGASWVQRTPATNPGGRVDHEMAYDASRRRCVIYGGWGSVADAWEWDGVDWSRMASAPNPGARYAQAFCFDSATHRVLLFGGYQSGQRADTWTFGVGSPAAYATSGVGCAGPAGVPTIAPGAGSLPYVGEAFVASCAGLGSGPSFGIIGISATAWGGLGLPFDMSSIGMTACLLRTDPLFIVPLTNVGGAASWSLPIPNDAILAGGQFHQQLLDAQAGANPAGMVLGNLGTATIGVR